VLRVPAHQDPHVDVPNAAHGQAPRFSIARLGLAPVAGNEQSVWFATPSCSCSPGVVTQRVAWLTASLGEVMCLDERPTG
jgi:hypothetical protein